MAQWALLRGEARLAGNRAARKAAASGSKFLSAATTSAGAAPGGCSDSAAAAAASSTAAADGHAGARAEGAAASAAAAAAAAGVDAAASSPGWAAGHNCRRLARALVPALCSRLHGRSGAPVVLPSSSCSGEAVLMISGASGTSLPQHRWSSSHSYSQSDMVVSSQRMRSVVLPSLLSPHITTHCAFYDRCLVTSAAAVASDAGVHTSIQQQQLKTPLALAQAAAPGLCLVEVQGMGASTSRSKRISISSSGSSSTSWDSGSSSGNRNGSGSGTLSDCKRGEGSETGSGGEGGRKTTAVYLETYGCQMNVNDMEIVLGILNGAGYGCLRVGKPEDADIILINTCAIRDNAESKVWHRLNYFRHLKSKWRHRHHLLRAPPSPPPPPLLPSTLPARHAASSHGPEETAATLAPASAAAAAAATGAEAAAAAATAAEVGRQSRGPPKVAVLGCMASRLKERLVEADKMVDVVCGPDAYRDLPRLLDEADAGHAGISTALSLEETYADVSPVRLTPSAVSAFVSVMRGCDNLCSFCVVPFTRGRERSRAVATVLREVGELVDSGVKEVILLGQNVNSYRDVASRSPSSLLFSSSSLVDRIDSSTLHAFTPPEDDPIPATSFNPAGLQAVLSPPPRLREPIPPPSLRGTGGVGPEALAEGFSTIYKRKEGGLRFTHLLDAVSSAFPDVRFRFTSPHPKDFPDDLLYLMRERANVCSSLHLPAQSGSSAVLQRMRRGYTREAYLRLVEKVEGVLPGVGLSSDFITGFCGETEEEHEATLSLVEAVGYHMCYMFKYSQREKTHAHRRYADDVPEDVKARRLEELVSTFRRTTVRRYTTQVGKVQVVLVEGTNKRDVGELMGKNDAGQRVMFPRHLAARDALMQGVTGRPDSRPLSQQEVQWLCVEANRRGGRGAAAGNDADGSAHAGRGQAGYDAAFSFLGQEPIRVGDFVEVLVTSSTFASLRGVALRKVTCGGQPVDVVPSVGYLG